MALLHRQVGRASKPSWFERVSDWHRSRPRSCLVGQEGVGWDGVKSWEKCEGWRGKNYPKPLNWNGLLLMICQADQSKCHHSIMYWFVIREARGF